MVALPLSSSSRGNIYYHPILASIFNGLLFEDPLFGIELGNLEQVSVCDVLPGIVATQALLVVPIAVGDVASFALLDKHSALSWSWLSPPALG